MEGVFAGEKHMIGEIPRVLLIALFLCQQSFLSAWNVLTDCGGLLWQAQVNLSLALLYGLALAGMFRGAVRAMLLSLKSHISFDVVDG